MSEPNCWTLFAPKRRRWIHVGANVCVYKGKIIGRSLFPAKSVEVIERSAYDALSARLAAVEKERDEAVALLQTISAQDWSKSFWPAAKQLADVFLARLAKPEGGGA